MNEFTEPIIIIFEKMVLKNFSKSINQLVMTPLIKLSTINDEVNNFAQSSKNKNNEDIYG